MHLAVSWFLKIDYRYIQHTANVCMYVFVDVGLSSSHIEIIWF